MKCEKCGAEINSVLVDLFNRDGGDGNVILPLTECEESAAYVDTTQNWTGYELSEEEQRETILCPKCKQFPFKNPEIQVHEYVRIVCFTEESGGEL